MQLSNVTRGVGLSLAVALIGAAAAHAADPYASAPPYARPLVPGIVLQPLVTTGQKIALTGGAPGDSFRYVGIPDGLGAFGGNGALTLLTHHEFTLTSGGVAGPMPTGARISNLQLSYSASCGSARVVSGQYEIRNVYKGEPPVLQAPGTPRMTRFCSAFLADQKVGFDRPVMMSGEESGGAATFDGQGASAFATWNGECYHLPRLGHFNWENQVVLPGTGAQTVVIGLEDAGSLTSQIYVYVGTKNPGAPANDWLSLNGLNNGQSYVFCFDDAAHKNEATFVARGTSTTGHWTQINYTLSDVQLEAQAQSLGSFNFVRVEDGASDPRTSGVFYFVTTGSPGSANPYGRLYKLTFDPANILAGATLTLVLDGTEGIVSPDNIDINRHGQMLICEDPNYLLSGAPLNLTRDTYLWSFFVDTPAVNPTPVAEMDRPAQQAHALGIPGNSVVAGTNRPGDQEFSGVIDAEEWFGPGTWLFDIQAHALRIAPTAETVEGGQVLLLRPECPIPVEQSLLLTGEAVADAYRLSWNMSDPDARLDGYRVMRAASASGPWASVTDGLLSAATHRFEDAPGAGTWFYRVEALSRGAVVATAGPVRAELGGSLPVLAKLEAPTPNPSHGNAVLSFSIPAGLEGSRVSLTIYDVAGRVVASLLKDKLVAAGRQSLTWNGLNAYGQRVSGVYFAELATAQGVQRQRVTITK